LSRPSTSLTQQENKEKQDVDARHKAGHDETPIGTVDTNRRT
jgi:hypothetical protein